MHYTMRLNAWVFVLVSIAVVYADAFAGTDVSLLSYEPTTYVALPGDRSVVMSTAPSQFRLVRPGLTNAPNTLSIMSVEKPGWYLRHYGYRLFLEPIDNPRNKHIFRKDATFTERVDVFNKGSTSFQSVNYPKLFISRVGNRDLNIQRPSTDVLKDSASFAVNASVDKTLMLYGQGKYIALENNAAIVSEKPMLFQLVRPGLTNAPNTVSIMSAEKPGWYLRHYGYRLYLEPIANPRNAHIFDIDATFTERENVFFDGFTSFQSVNYPNYYISSNENQQLFIRRKQGTDSFKKSASFFIDSDVTLASFAPKRYISMDNNAALVSGQQTQFRLVRPGLTQAPGTVSIMSVLKPGWFLRHYGYRLYLEPIANPRNPGLFAKDATFTERSDAFLDGFTAFQSVSYPDYYISFDTWQQLSIRRFENTNVFKESASFAAITGTA